MDAIKSALVTFLWNPCCHGEETYASVPQLKKYASILSMRSVTMGIKCVMVHHSHRDNVKIFPIIIIPLFLSRQMIEFSTCIIMINALYYR